MFQLIAVASTPIHAFPESFCRYSTQCFHILTTVEIMKCVERAMNQLRFIKPATTSWTLQRQCRIKYCLVWDSKLTTVKPDRKIASEQPFIMKVVTTIMCRNDHVSKRLDTLLAVLS